MSVGTLHSHKTGVDNVQTFLNKSCTPLMQNKTTERGWIWIFFFFLGLVSTFLALARTVSRNESDLVDACVAHSPDGGWRRPTVGAARFPLANVQRSGCCHRPSPSSVRSWNWLPASVRPRHRIRTAPSTSSSRLSPGSL